MARLQQSRGKTTVISTIFTWITSIKPRPGPVGTDLLTSRTEEDSVKAENFDAKEWNRCFKGRMMQCL